MKKIALAFPGTSPGEVDKNLKSHLTYLDRLEELDLLVFPPLSLSGDGLGSLYKRREILETSSYLDHFKNPHSLVLVGLPLVVKGRLFSTMALIKEDILGFYPLRAREAIFSDPELFPEELLAPDILPLRLLVDDSFSYPGKDRAILSSLASKRGASLYLSPSQDYTTSGGIHASRFILASSGKLLKKSIWIMGFHLLEIEEDNKLYGLESFEEKTDISSSPYPFLAQEDKYEVYQELLDHQALAYGLRLKRVGLSHSLLGISGGLDSTWALLATLRAHELMDLPKNNIHSIVMPGFGSSQDTMKAALSLLMALDLEPQIISINKAVRGHFRDIGHDEKVQDLVYENSQARERTQILMDLANKFSGLVVGTGDMSENAQGWSTYNGDQMSMYAINGGLPKTLIQDLIDWYARKSDRELKDALHYILKRPISPELLPPDDEGQIVQKTEETLGSYKLIDFILYHFLNNTSLEEIGLLLRESFPELSEEDISDALSSFLRRFITQQFKRTASPDSVKLTQPSLLDFVMASDISARTFVKDLL